MKTKIKFYNKEEKELYKSLQNDEWLSELKESDKEMYEAIARETLNKTKRINLRLSERDLKRIKSRALHEGLPYQSLIARIIHKYLSGNLKEV